MISCLRQVFRGKGLAPPELSADTPLDGSLGLESLDFAELVVRLEKEFGVDPFANAPPTQIRTVAELAACYQAD